MAHPKPVYRLSLNLYTGCLLTGQLFSLIISRPKDRLRANQSGANRMLRHEPDPAERQHHWPPQLGRPSVRLFTLPAILSCLAIATNLAAGQEKHEPPAGPVLFKNARIFDGKSERLAEG